MKKRYVVSGVLLLALVSMTVMGCGSKVSKENYEKIKDGMSLADVEKLLGEGEVQGGAAGAIANLGGSAKMYKWTDGDKVITITFVNDKVSLKASSGL